LKAKNLPKFKELRPTPNLALGVLIRARRSERELRLADLSAATGLSMSFLSQLERGLTNPSLNSLIAIANALDTTSHALLSAVTGGSSDVDTVSPDGGALVPFDGGSARSLLHGARPVQPMEVVGGFTEFPEFIYHPSPEFVYICDGDYVWQLENRGTYELRAGSTLYFAANVGHRWKIVNPEEKHRLLLVVVGEPGSGHGPHG
jgi:transcriptional regulator with XRE-family HTH domain